MNKAPLLALALLCALPGKADEGMWMLTDLKQQNEVVMKELGLMMPIEGIYNPNGIALKDAVVHFGGGCTGEVISAEGLILTNHHCGYSSIQQHSSVEHDYLTDGFWAMTRQEELPCKGLTVTFIDKILDVTSYVRQQLQLDEDPQGTNYLSPSYLGKVAKHFVQAGHVQVSPGQSVELKAFYGGNAYYLFVKTTYRDIRMVGAPPSSIGKFGSDTDNWTWPRHTGDFSLFRIYASPDGTPSDYAPENKPLRVKKHLTISLNGYKEGDFAFIMGFPGRNWRYMTSDEVEERMQTTNFMRIHIREALQDMLMKEMLKNDTARIHYAARYASSANYWKNALGMNEGLVKLGVLDEKRAQQEKLLKRGEMLGDTSYQAAFGQIQSIVKKRRPAMYHQQAIQEALVTGAQILRIPNTTLLVTALKSKKKRQIRAATDSLRKVAGRYFASMPFPDIERKAMKEMLRAYAHYIPEDQRIGIFQVIDKRFNGDTDKFVDACAEHSIFGSSRQFEKFIKKPSLYRISSDWMVLLRYSVTDGLLQTSLEMMDINRRYNAAHRIWVQGINDMKRAEGLPIYPDANSTLRLTYGKVASYSPSDAVVNQYFTTLGGVMQKEDPQNYEFIVPERLKQLYETKDFGHYAMADGVMPVCFIVDTDNTGGNSGSPVFNAKGQLIGTAFDRNYEGLTGDIAFRPSSQRAICVDIRYILFIIEKYAGASHIIDELDIARQETATAN